MGRVIIRATLAVFVCCLLYEFFDIGTGIPFYAGIAAVICLQSEIKSTVRVGLNRTVGTLFGGFTGMGILYLTHNYYILSRPILRYALITLCIIPLMYIANIIRKVRELRRQQLSVAIEGGQSVCQSLGCEYKGSKGCKGVITTCRSFHCRGLYIIGRCDCC